MKKHIKNFVFLLSVVTVLIILINKIISLISNIKESSPADTGKFYNWKYGKIYYSKHGSGSPLLLIHDLEPTSSHYEWSRVAKKLSRTNTVYTIDLLGCGRSDKPNITYTNYLYVQLLNDFIKNVIDEKTDVVATGDSFSFVVMACQMEPELYSKLIGVTPTDLHELAKSPSKRKNVLKLILELPVIGTFIYNIAVSKHRITDTMVNYYFYKGYLVSPQMIHSYYQAAHRGDGNGRYLLASLKCNYTNANIVTNLKKINNSICLIGGKQHPYSEDIIKDYKTFNPAIEDAYISHTCCLPQLEAPTKFVSLLNIILNS